MITHYFGSRKGDRTPADARKADEALPSRKRALSDGTTRAARLLDRMLHPDPAAATELRPPSVEPSAIRSPRPLPAAGRPASVSTRARDDRRRRRPTTLTDLWAAQVAAGSSVAAADDRAVDKGGLGGASVDVERGVALVLGRLAVFADTHPDLFDTVDASDWPVD